MSCLRSFCWLIAIAITTGHTATAWGQGDVTSPTDFIELVMGTDDGDGAAGEPPAGESVDHVIDNVTQKYLNFVDLSSGFKVTPAVGDTIVSAIRFYTANDAEERDPASYLFEGSSDGTTFATIASGSLALPADRNPGGAVAIDPSIHFNQVVTFPNTLEYSTYRLTFPALKNAASANSMQIAEVELLGVSGGSVVADANGDGVVNISDFDIIRSNFRTTVPAGENGDVNFTGNVDFEDFRLWKAVFGGGGPSNVPEPSTVSLIVVGCAGLFLARRARARG